MGHDARIKWDRMMRYVRNTIVSHGDEGLVRCVVLSDLVCLHFVDVLKHIVFIIKDSYEQHH